MSLLPQFIYLFQNLPVTVPRKSLEAWQREFVNFVWRKDIHRINKQFLSRPKKLGGYGLPILENYYIAAQLQTVYTFLASLNLPGWGSNQRIICFTYSFKRTSLESKGIPWY